MNQAAHEGRKIVSSVGMVVTLTSFAMLFATLMMGFAIYRFTTPMWPPQGMAKPELLIPTLSTLSIFLSSIAFIWFEKNPVNKLGLYLTLGLGLLFMRLQFYFWSELKSQGIVASSGIFGSIIYAFTWVHAAHIVAALLLLVWLIIQTQVSGKSLENSISNVGKFWHFLGLVWAIMFLTIFVL
jgi:cytochrome c oxidase subunit 3